MLSDDPNKDDLSLLQAREVAAHACKHRQACKPNDSGRHRALIKTLETHLNNACWPCSTQFAQNHGI